MTWIDSIIAWYSAHMNYVSITALMTIESSFIPFPSEVVIPPAAFVATQPESVLAVSQYDAINILLIVLFGTLGAMLGALINYYLAVWLGRPLVYRFADSRLGHMCLLSGEKIKKAEDYFCQHGNMSTFVGRFIPGIRQLISVPAGLAKMRILPFLGYTFLGAFCWNIVLALLGYLAAGQLDLIRSYSHHISIAILAVLALVVVCWTIRKFARKS